MCFLVKPKCWVPIKHVWKYCKVRKTLPLDNVLSSVLLMIVALCFIHCFYFLVCLCFVSLLSALIRFVLFSKEFRFLLYFSVFIVSFIWTIIVSFFNFLFSIFLFFFFFICFGFSYKNYFLLSLVIEITFYCVMCSTFF